MTEKYPIKDVQKKYPSTISRVARFYSGLKDEFPGPGKYMIKEAQNNKIKFAVSRRSPLFSVVDSPSPGHYRIPSCFDAKKSFSFSPRYKKPAPSGPGPGDYQVKEVVFNSSRAVFGNEKRKDNFIRPELLFIPGPGRYSFLDTINYGPKWKFGSYTSRKYPAIEQSPGPGEYSLKPLKDTTAYRFPSSRKNVKIEKVPGPGHYFVSSPYRSPSFSIAKADKFQRISGPILPGPSDYSFDLSCETPLNRRSSKKISGTLSTLNSCEIIRKVE